VYPPQAINLVLLTIVAEGELRRDVIMFGKEIQVRLTEL
jgi:hypothetical protein